MKTIKAILYARFSPRPNADECESVTNQLIELREFCKEKGWEVISERWDEERSGADEDRPGLIDALHDLRRGAVLVVRDWKRLARNTMYALWIEQQVSAKGATMVTLDNGGALVDLNDPASSMMRTLLHAIAEYDRHMRNRRTSAGMRRNQRQGRRQSSILPYGFRHDYDGPLNPLGVPELMIVDATETHVIAVLHRWREEGMSYRQIAGRLNEWQIKAPHGDTWHPGTLGRILKT